MTVHIGCGAGFAGDRFDAALPILASMAVREGPRFLIYEVLGERTLALAQKNRRRDPTAGASPYLEKYLRPSLAEAKRLGVRIVTNMGAADPAGAAEAVARLARDLGLEGLRIAAVLGDDLTARFTRDDLTAFEVIEGDGLGAREVLSANAYLGAAPIADALATGADIVLVGRSTDSALVLGPLLHAYGWAPDAWDLLAAGTICGHLLECGGQVSGTYFADPGFKDVPDLAHAGFPIAEVGEDGAFVITKPGGTGGCVTPATVIEQLLYELHDPGAYVVADCVADIRNVSLHDVGPDRVALTGVRGRAATETLKATVCVDAGWLAEAELTYAGPNALARADLAGDVVRTRLADLGLDRSVRIEILGTGAVHDGGSAERRAHRSVPCYGEYRLRVAAHTDDRTSAERVTDEVLSLYCSGPAAGGGYRRHITEELATVSLLIPRDRVEPYVHIVEVTA